ncbi:ABC transporter ATP-binding protein [Woeseiaceae bacterium]|nr:ABC transporter ATP-binding protein [Woeseiaceae bacterium]
MLSVKKLRVSYKLVPAVVDVDFEMGEGEIQVILGANGAGKTTIIKSIMGLLKLSDGSIVFNKEHELHKLKSFMIHRLGISWVPEGREIWGTLSVLENLRMGAFIVSDRKEINRRVQENFKLFPILQEKENQLASLLSGGEQQILAIARCLMSKPKLILMDEPSLGLAPMMVNRVFRIVQNIKQRGISILMAEQNAHKALQIADRVYFLEMGRIVDRGLPQEIASRNIVRKVFLGDSA